MEDQVTNSGPIGEQVAQANAEASETPSERVEAVNAGIGQAPAENAEQGESEDHLGPAYHNGKTRVIPNLSSLVKADELAGSDVIIMDELRNRQPDLFNESGQMDYKRFETEVRGKFPIQIRNDKNSISFTLQKGPIKEVGVNGCQVDAIIEAARNIIQGFDKEFPDENNEKTIKALDEAISWLQNRRVMRERRGVEGTNQA